MHISISHLFHLGSQKESKLKQKTVPSRQTLKSKETVIVQYLKYSNEIVEGTFKRNQKQLMSRFNN